MVLRQIGKLSVVLCLERTKHLDLRSAVRWCELVFLVSINLDDCYLHCFNSQKIT